MKIIPTPINVAEAIFEPFWDPQLSGLKNWKITDGSSYGLKVFQNWCWVNFEWTALPPHRRPLFMELNSLIPCKGYNRLLLVINAPPKSIVILSALTDKGRFQTRQSAHPTEKIEVALPITNSNTINKIQIAIETNQQGSAAGWIAWLGLQNTSLLKTHLSYWRRNYPVPETYLTPVDKIKKFKPIYGIMVPEETIKSDRKNKSALAYFMELRKKAKEFVPETLRNESLRVHMDNRYNRVRDHKRPFNIQCSELARAGLVLKDPFLLRLAARAAIAKAMCPNWEENPLCEFPGGIFEHRCFTHTELMEDICHALDLAGEAFNETGRDYILRRIAEEGLGRTNFIIWKHDYIFRNNQLSAFSPGRIAVYALLSKHWRHVEPYMELAYKELCENMNNILLPDGGYAEGPSYFSYGVGFGIRAFEYYARWKKIPLSKVIPKRLAKTANMAWCLGSTCPENDFIPFGDAIPHFGIYPLKLFASCVPDSAWSLLHKKAVAHHNKKPLPAIEWPPFIRLPNMGVLASHRKIKNEWLKIFVSGCTANADHNHEDKGSFVIEFAGETFALDPGRHCYYGTSAAALVKNCELHNMLIPFGNFNVRPCPELPHPTKPFPRGIVAYGKGDKVNFNAFINPTLGYEKYFKLWKRFFISKSPEILTIKDVYHLANGDGVDFLWQTTLPVTITNNQIIIQGQKGRCTITTGLDTHIGIEEVAREKKENCPEKIHRRIRIRKKGKVGFLEVKVFFELV